MVENAVQCSKCKTERFDGSGPVRRVGCHVADVGCDVAVGVMLSVMMAVSCERQRRFFT